MKLDLKNFKIPHVFIFLSYIIFFCAVLTYIVPSGTYQRTTKTVGHIEQTMVIPGSYEVLPKHFSLKGLILGDKVEGEASPTSLLGLFSSIPKGMNQAASLVFFVLIVGAVFNLITESGTVNVVMYDVMERFRSKPFFLFLGIFIALAAAASFMGMGSEFIPLIPLFMLISKETGRDRMFGIALFLLPGEIGWTTAITNPFTVQIAQNIAEVPIGSGIGLRIVLFVITVSIGFFYLMRYGNMVKRDPSKSLMPNDSFEISGDITLHKEKITYRHILIIITSLVLFALILYAVQTMGWGLIEMSGGFFMVGLTTILISNMNGERSMRAFIKGLEMMIIPALVVGFARGIQVVLFEGQIIDTILFETASLLETMPKIAAAEGMMIFQSLLNFIIPSASGQALVTMPLMVPLADLIDISRQTSVLAFILGDGFSNMIIPTNGVLMAILGIGLVPFEKWFKFVLPIFLIMMAIAFIFIYVAIEISY